MGENQVVLCPQYDKELSKVLAGETVLGLAFVDHKAFGIQRLSLDISVDGGPQYQAKTHVVHFPSLLSVRLGPSDACRTSKEPLGYCVDRHHRGLEVNLGVTRSYVEAEKVLYRGQVRRSDNLPQALLSSHVFVGGAQTSPGEVGLHGIHVPLESTTSA